MTETSAAVPPTLAPVPTDGVVTLRAHRMSDVQDLVAPARSRDGRPRSAGSVVSSHGFERVRGRHDLCEVDLGEGAWAGAGAGCDRPCGRSGHEGRAPAGVTGTVGGRAYSAPVQLVRMSCCGREWVGPDRAHCCVRTRGCGQVFDDAELWDAHRTAGGCTDPRMLGLVQTRNGIWLRTLDQAG